MNAETNKSVCNDGIYHLTSKNLFGIFTYLEDIFKKEDKFDSDKLHMILMNNVDIDKMKTLLSLYDEVYNGNLHHFGDNELYEVNIPYRNSIQYTYDIMKIIDDIKVAEAIVSPKCKKSVKKLTRALKKKLVMMEYPLQLEHLRIREILEDRINQLKNFDGDNKDIQAYVLLILSQKYLTNYKNERNY